MRRMIIAATLAGLLAGCQQEPEQTSQTSGGSGPATDAVAQARIGSWGVDLDNRDPNIRPGDDFFGYANGSWLKNYELPADKSSYGSFQALHEQSQERVKLLVEELAEADPQPGSIEQKIGDYYLSYLDTEAIDSAGLTPIAAQLQAIADVDSQLQLIELFGRVDLDGNQSPIEAGIDIDRMNPERWIVDVSVGGLGLPDRDYYLEDSARFSDIRAAYQAHIEKMLTLIGFDNAATAAQAVMALETSIAEVLWPRSQRRNRDLTYNLMSLEALQAAYPNFAWRGYFAANGVVPEEINLRYPSATGPVLDIIANTDLNTWKAYLSYHLLTRNAFALAQEIDDATFDFYGRVLRGQPEQQERWRRGVGLVSGRNGMGDAIGQVYVERYFPAANKAMMEDLVENLREGLRQRIAGLEWMSEDTKAYAFEKLQAFTPNIGYPSEWEDFSSVQIRADDLMGNVRAMREWQRADALERLTRPTDPAEWFMSPQTVNAYYVAQFNSITFPAGILEPPFFDPAADPAVNYGAIGAVIGHEIGHVVGNHAKRANSTARLGNVAGFIGSILTGTSAISDLSNSATNTLVTGYRRDYELEADQLGGEYLAKAGYNPLAIIDTIHVLKDHALFAKNVLKQPTVYHGLFSTHPKNDKRLYEAVQQSQHLFPDELQEPVGDFWEMVNGLAYGNEATAGLIKGTTYYHAALRVVIAFPSDWDVVNTTSEIIGKPIVGTGDASIAVSRLASPAADETPLEYLTDTLKRDDLSNGREIEVNGFSGYMADIEVADGSVQARRIAVIFKNSEAYLFEGELANGADAKTFERNWNETVNSFRAMTAADLKVANEQRIEVIVATPEDTFASLARKSSIKRYPEETLRVINGMHPVGEPRAGDYIKIVQ